MAMHKVGKCLLLLQRTIATNLLNALLKTLIIVSEVSREIEDTKKNFTLLYKANCPCVLTENFFYDNKEDCKYMLSDEGKDAIVEAHYRAILEYMK